MQLLHGGRQLQEGHSLKNYSIAKVSLIFLASQLNEGAKGSGAPSSSQSRSFKDTLNPGLSQMTRKNILGPTFIVEQAKDIPSLEVEDL